MKTNRTFAILPLLLLVTLNVAGQSSLLNRKISVQLKQVPLNDALDKIGKAGGFSFSYDADIIRGNRPVTIQTRDTKVEKVLDDLFNDEICPKQVGTHVVLIPNPKEPSKPIQKKEFIVSGTIRDAGTQLVLDHVTIYDVNTRITAISDTLGNYRLILQGKEGITGINYSRIGYHDTVLLVTIQENKPIDILLKPIQSDIRKMTGREALLSSHDQDTLILLHLPVTEVEQIRLVKWFVPRKSRETARNLEIYGTRPFQASLVPYIGTNGRTSGSVANAVSLNLLAGYSRETNGFELGGLMNINRHRMKGFQLAGLGNIVGRSVSGFQLAGLFNINLGPVRGFQLAGLVNWLSDTMKGMQLAGLCNITRGKMRGFELAGLFNVTTHHVDGWQIAGLGNIGLHEVNKVQISGLVNYGLENWGFQLSGLLNISKKDNRGAQIAGLLNYTKTLNGFQLAVFNVVNTVESGVPVGFFSYVNHGGYYKFEISADEVFYVNLSFRAGTRHFYNIFKIGAGDTWMMNFTYGFGTAFNISNRFTMCLDLTTGVVASTTTGLKYHGLLGKLFPTFDIRLAKRLVLFFGPTANIYWFNTGNTIKPDGIAPYTLYDQTFTTGPHRIQIWAGGIVGIKVF